jgi:hypothetical protein
MSFSATGNLLPGSLERPDTVTYRTCKLLGRGTSTSITTAIHKLNLYGYIPVVSTFTGLGRALLGVVHTIVHLAASIFSKHKNHHFQEAWLGAKNIGRGVVEAIPIIGNITMLIVDLLRVEKFEKMVMAKINLCPSNYNNCIAVFNDGQEIARSSPNEVCDEIEGLAWENKKVDLNKIISPSTGHFKANETPLGTRMK